MSSKILLNIGFGNTVTKSEVVALIQPNSAPVKRFIREKRERSELMDATMGKKVRSVILLKSNTILLSAISVSSLAARMEETAAEAAGQTQN